MFYAVQINSIGNFQWRLMGASDSMAKHFTVSWLETNLGLLLGSVPDWVGLPHSFTATCHLGARGCGNLSCGTLYVTPVGLVSLAGDPGSLGGLLHNGRDAQVSEAALCPLPCSLDPAKKVQSQHSFKRRERPCLFHGTSKVKSKREDVRRD